MNFIVIVSRRKKENDGCGGGIFNIEVKSDQVQKIVLFFFSVTFLQKLSTVGLRSIDLLQKFKFQKFII